MTATGSRSILFGGYPHHFCTRRHLRTTGSPSWVKGTKTGGQHMDDHYQFTVDVFRTVCVRLEAISADLRLMVESGSSFVDLRQIEEMPELLRDIAQSWKLQHDGASSRVRFLNSVRSGHRYGRVCFKNHFLGSPMTGRQHPDARIIQEPPRDPPIAQPPGSADAVHVERSRMQQMAELARDHVELHNPCV